MDDGWQRKTLSDGDNRSTNDGDGFRRPSAAMGQTAANQMVGGVEEMDGGETERWRRMGGEVVRERGLQFFAKEPFKKKSST